MAPSNTPTTIHGRMTQFKGIPIDAPLLMARFVERTKEYISYLQPLGAVDGEWDVQSEEQKANTYIDIAFAERVWPVVQYVAVEILPPLSR